MSTAAPATGTDAPSREDVPSRESGRDLMFAGGIVFILAVLFLPIPTVLIDFGLTLSIALSVLILMVALWIARPLDFSSFPTILLVATMLRLSMNIATTRAILSDGHEGTSAAGHVIGGFSRFVMSGDFVIGLTVFAILVIVNFVVITKGSTRIAEVGARFTLDAIPGKQMSIDADLSAGVIDDAEAQRRRRELEEESAFFGSMDGASKFVRGDAVAGLIITAINILGGIVIGTTRHGMSLGEAADVFVKLSVGDGLVSQIPALVVSLAAGLLVSKGGTRGSADEAVFRQLGAHPKALQLAGALLMILGLTPGLPFVPFALLALGAFGVAWWVLNERKRALAREAEAESAQEEHLAREARDSVRSSLATCEIELVMGHQLSAHMAPLRDELTHRMVRMRQRFARDYGFVIPEVRLVEDVDIPPKQYRIRIHGAVAAAHEMRIGEVLALVGDAALPDMPGEAVTEPAYGMRAWAVSEAFRDDLEQRGFRVADDVALLLTHLAEIVRTNLPQLLSYKDTRTLIASLDPAYGKLADELCSGPITYPGLQAVLRHLLAEQVSIRNLPLIIEAVAEVAQHVRRPERIVEHVRMRIASQLCGDLARVTPDGTNALDVLRLGAHWDEAFHAALKRDPSGEVSEFAMTPATLEAFGRAVSAAIREQLAAGRLFAVVSAPEVRSYVRMIVERLYPNVAVLSHVEIARGLEVNVVGQVAAPDAEAG